MEKLKALAQGRSSTKIVQEICDLAEGRIKALDWYAQMLVEEIYQANKENSSIDDVHATLIYQHVDSLNALLDNMRSYLPKKEVKA